MWRTGRPHGQTLHDLVKTGGLDKGAKTRLTQLHRSLMLDAFDTARTSASDQTFVFTDPHLGNLADDGKHAYAFDPGQYARMKPAEADLFVRMLVAAGTDSLRASMRDELIGALAGHCTVFDDKGGDRTVEQRLGDAYDQAMSEGSESVGHSLQLFFNACNKSGLDVPQGFFAGAKMMHILHGQARDLGLGDHIQETVRDLYVRQLGPWGKVTTWLKTR